MTTSRLITNWAGNIAFTAARVHRPRTVAELREIVASSTKVRALGTGHCFNRIADTPEDLVSVAELPRVIDIDPATGTAVVSAGLRYSQVAEQVHRAGYALPNLASLPHISIAGACATGTHGSGDRNGGLATAVSALRMVGPDGEMVELSRRDDPGRFPGVVVALGALGVITELTLDLIPDFEVAQHVYEGLELDRLAERFDDAFGAAYSVSVFTNWIDPTSSLWLKHSHSPDQSPTSAPTPIPTPDPTWLGAHLAHGQRHPIPTMPPDFCTQQGGIPGPWHERLPHFRPDFTPSSGEELQSEFLLPRATAPQAIAALRGLATQFAPVLQISEIRTIAADDLWLSPAYGRDSAAFHFTWIADTAAVTPVLAAVEEQLAPLGARPHWGKLFTTAPDHVIGLYERADDFHHLMRSYDPNGKFRNAFIDALFPPLPEQ